MVLRTFGRPFQRAKRHRSPVVLNDPHSTNACCKGRHHCRFELRRTGQIAGTNTVPAQTALL
jgi:hypothetical protein